MGCLNFRQNVKKALTFLSLHLLRFLFLSLPGSLSPWLSLSPWFTLSVTSPGNQALMLWAAPLKSHIEENQGSAQADTWERTQALCWNCICEPCEWTWEQILHSRALVRATAPTLWYILRRRHSRDTGDVMPRQLVHTNGEILNICGFKMQGIGAI